MVDSAAVDQTIDKATLDLIWEAQRSEITEYVICNRLAARVQSPHNREVLEMALISLGVATISFALGWVVRLVFGIDG